MEIFICKDKQGNRMVNMLMVDGIPQYPRNTVVSISQDDAAQKLSIKKGNSKDTPVTLNYSQVVSVSYDSEKEVTVKDKNSLGRAVVGSAFGPLGAILGGISGVGAKHKTKVRYLLTIGYKSSKNEEKELVFETTSVTFGIESFVSEFTKKIITVTEL